MRPSFVATSPSSLARVAHTGVVLIHWPGLVFRYVEGARSLHIHPHTLDEVLAKKTLVGRSSMPYLFRKHPDAKAAMGFHRFDPPRPGDPAGLNLRRRVYRALLRRPVYTLVKPLARPPLGGLTNLAIDYLVLYHYLQGMKSPLETRQ